MSIGIFPLFVLGRSDKERERPAIAQPLTLSHTIPIQHHVSLSVWSEEGSTTIHLHIVHVSSETRRNPSRRLVLHLDRQSFTASISARSFLRSVDRPPRVHKRYFFLHSMSTTRRVATRHSPPHVKKTALKTARSVPSAKNAIAPRITVRGASTKTKRSKEEEREDEVFEFEEDEMTTSFLQYWYGPLRRPQCPKSHETQILTPR